MKAVRVHEYGQPPRIDGIPELTLRATRCPHRGGRGRVCRSELHIVEGRWAKKSGVELPSSSVTKRGTVLEAGRSRGNRLSQPSTQNCGALN